MGVHDSSWTRVAPVFSRLFERDPTGVNWLPRLLELPTRPDGKRPMLPPRLGNLTEHRWTGHGGEKRLPPPKTLLEHLLDHRTATPPPDFGTRNPKTRELREQLFSGDEWTLSEARALVRKRGYVGGAWYVFEGRTAVDAYLETPELVVLIEGKRTERTTTVKTRWMSARHQILRNLDAAWDRGDDKSVVALFIIEGDGDPPGGCSVPPDWQSMVADTLSPFAVQASLPHRAEVRQRELTDSFLGATTWQAVCSHFGIDWSEIRDLTYKRGG